MAPRIALALALAVACLGAGAAADEEAARALPRLPQQFAAKVTTIAHLVDRSKEYPPWRKVMHVRFDAVNKLASAQIEEGHDAGKLFIRRYDEKWEYAVRGGKYPGCERAYLSEEMPEAALPGALAFQGIVDIDGVRCEHWAASAIFSNWHVYVTEDGHVPRRVVDVFPDGTAEGEKVMTYEFEDVQLGPQDAADFALPEPYTHKTCERQIGGFPYIHAFLHFIRF